MTERNPYVTGPTLERHPCSDTDPHVQHIERNEGPEFLCDGVHSTSPLAVARWLATQEYAMRVYEETEETERDEISAFDGINLVADPVYPGRRPDLGDDLKAHTTIDWNMTNHAPANEDVVARFEAVREFGKSFAHAIVDLCPASRDRDLALQHTEDALMRAVAAIARNQSVLEPFLKDADHFEDSFLPEDRNGCFCARMPAEEGDETVLVVVADCPEHGAAVTAFESADDLEAAAAEALSRPEPPARPPFDADATEDEVNYVGAPDNDPAKDQQVDFGDVPVYPPTEKGC